MEPDRERALFELVGYMVTSARNLLDETPMYGPFRLVDAASRLIDWTGAEASPRLLALREAIETGKTSVMTDAAEFRAFLDGLVFAVVERLDDPSRGGEKGGDARGRT